MKSREEYLLEVFNRFAGLRNWMIKEKNLSKRNSKSTTTKAQQTVL